jgi:hypothetical protein
MQVEDLRLCLETLNLCRATNAIGTSNSYVTFSGGYGYTENVTSACSYEFDLGVSCAFDPTKIIKFLKKLKGDSVLKISKDGGKIVFKTKKHRVTVDNVIVGTDMIDISYDNFIPISIMDDVHSYLKYIDPRPDKYQLTFCQCKDNGITVTNGKFLIHKEYDGNSFGEFYINVKTQALLSKNKPTHYYNDNRKLFLKCDKCVYIIKQATPEELKYPDIAPIVGICANDVVINLTPDQVSELMESLVQASIFTDMITLTFDKYIGGETIDYSFMTDIESDWNKPIKIDIKFILKALQSIPSDVDLVLSCNDGFTTLSADLDDGKVKCVIANMRY